MAYLDTRRRPSFSSMAAVIAIHGAVGAALILGLTVSGIIKPRTHIDVFTDPLPPPPPPTPEPEATKQSDPLDRKIPVPVPPIPLPQPTSPLETTTDDLPPLPPIPRGTGDATEPVRPSPAPSFAPVAAKPRNDPLRWVTTEDYRSNWIRQEMMGRARFRLEIAADGRVTNCMITASSGHPALDAATCALVSKRARFQPARGDDGEAVAGSYSNAIDWQLPE